MVDFHGQTWFMSVGAVKHFCFELEVENRYEALKPKTLKHYIIGYTNLKFLTPSLAIMTLFMSVLPSIKRSTLWGRKIARSEFCVRHSYVCEFGFTKIRFPWIEICFVVAWFQNDKIFRHEWQWIDNWFNITNEWHLYLQKKSAKKYSTYATFSRKKMGYFHIKSIQIPI